MSGGEPMITWIFLGIGVAVVVLIVFASRRQRLHGGSQWGSNRDRERHPKPPRYDPHA